SLKNTTGGTVLNQDYFAQAHSLAFNRGLKIHLDGARVASAEVAQSIAIADITPYFDSVSMGLSKGLCAPIGSILLGDERLIGKATRWRKMLGGGMRQAGIIAAAAKLALTEQVDRLADDHHNAKTLALLLAEMNELTVDVSVVQTNMVFATLAEHIDPKMLTAKLADKGIIISPSRQLRLVTHNNISANDINVFVNTLKKIIR
ncbi:low-specificity L-threonine aldolase, partial [Shewanella sp. SR41-2]|nr:low-specificity L-threonine aldolase [Shewanella sp. SR41-2]